jgi:hypothetical protein
MHSLPPFDPLEIYVILERDKMGHAEYALIRRRRRELIRVYADPVRTVLACRLPYKHGCVGLTSEMLDEHAKNVIILVLKSIDVRNHWPPDTNTDSDVESILEDYLDKLE